MHLSCVASFSHEGSSVLDWQGNSQMDWEQLQQLDYVNIHATETQNNTFLHKPNFVCHFVIICTNHTHEYITMT